MESVGKLSVFAKYAWFVLGYNLLVILWGVFLRASRSGDGCGQHWLTCGGEVVPSAPELKTVIEFSHRITSALDGLVVLALLVWALLIWRRKRDGISKYVLKLATASFIFVLIEGAVGAGLVLTGNTAETLTPARPFWMAGHLLNTLVLLALLTLTAWSATVGQRVKLSEDRNRLRWILLGAGLIFLVGTSGSIAALSSMIFPSGTITEGIAKDFSPTSHMLLRLRLLHPILAVGGAVFLVFWAGWLKREAESRSISRWANALSLLVIVQLGFGALTLLTLGPILMQLGHLLLADAVWIAFILLSANLLSAPVLTDQAADRHLAPASTIASSES
ncbi:MAG: COX15/CtaA family protein [Acidobacteria bacterium]|nr:COX15/CtaA family protein [Acidobacteriota bacterium]